MRLLSFAVIFLASCAGTSSHCDPEFRISASTPELSEVLADSVPPALRAVDTLPARRHVREIVIHAIEVPGTGYRGGSLPAEGSMELHFGSELRTHGWVVVRFLLTHELVHLHLPEVWRKRLPHCVEDGLADAIGLIADPEARHYRLAEYVDALRPVFKDPELLESCRSGFDLDLATYVALDRERLVRLVAFGYTLVVCIGIPGIESLVERAEAEGVERIPLDWFLEAFRGQDLPIEDLPLMDCYVTINQLRTKP